MSAGKRALILAGKVAQEDLPHLPSLGQGREVLVLARAWEMAHQCGCVPDRLVGPVDHVPSHIWREWRQRGAQHLPTYQDAAFASLEVALNYAITTGAKDILLLGLLEGTLAEGLGRLLLIARPEWAAARVSFLHRGEMGYILRHGEGVRIQGQGRRVGLLALSSRVTGLITQGLAPALHHAQLDFGHMQWLTSVEDVGHVWLGGGLALVLVVTIND